MRQSWDETWMRVADSIAGRSKCTNRQVGAVVVDQSNRPVSVGYNGSPAGYKAASSCAAFCPRSKEANPYVDRSSSYANCVSVHAEANALLFADRRDYAGGTIYVTNPCCWECSKLVANSGVSRVVFRSGPEDAHADIDTPTKFLEACGLQVVVIN